VRRANLIPQNDKQYGTFQTQASQAKAEVTFAQAEDLLSKRQYKEAMDAAERASTLGLARARVQDLQQRVAGLERLADAAGQPPPGPAAPATGPPQQTVAQTAPEPDGIPGTAAGQQQQQQQQQTGVPASPQGGPLAKLDPGLLRPPTLPSKQPPRLTVPKASLTRDSLPRAGLVAFFAGRYEEAATLLAATPGGPDFPRARFYLALSLAAQVLSGVGDDAGLTAAKARLREAGSLDQFNNDRRLISPRVLAALSIPR
jgi:hypothetical protein